MSCPFLILVLIIKPLFLTAPVLSPGKASSCICMPASAEQESIWPLWCAAGMWPHARLPCRSLLNMALIEFTGNKQVLIGRMTMTTAGYSGGHPQKRGGAPLSHHWSVLPSRRGSVGGWEAGGEVGLQTFVLLFFQGGSNKTIKSLGSGVLFTPTPLRSIVKEGAMWHVITANNK